MDVLRSHPPPSARLNPDAPIFIPMASYQTVEDYSDEWWALVHSSPFFRDYWLQDCFEDPQQADPIFPENDDLVLADLDSFFDHYLQQQEEEKVKEEKEMKELITVGALKWSKSKVVEAPRSFEKVPKIVKSVRVNPRTIHQPR